MNATTPLTNTEQARVMIEASSKLDANTQFVARRLHLQKSQRKRFKFKKIGFHHDDG
jgi:hypothetical protein